MRFSHLHARADERVHGRCLDLLGIVVVPAGVGPAEILRVGVAGGHSVSARQRADCAGGDGGTQASASWAPLRLRLARRVAVARQRYRHMRLWQTQRRGRSRSAGTGRQAGWLAVAGDGGCVFASRTSTRRKRMLGLTPAAGSRSVSRTPPLCEGSSGVQQWATAGSRSTASSSGGSDSGAITVMLPRPASQRGPRREQNSICISSHCDLMYPGTSTIISVGLLKKAATCLTCCQVLPRRDVLLLEQHISRDDVVKGGRQQRTNASAHTDDPAHQVWSKQVRGVVRSPRAAVAAQARESWKPRVAAGVQNRSERQSDERVIRERGFSSIRQSSTVHRATHPLEGNGQRQCNTIMDG
eukprot:COSAG06_NODE_5258_length_3604_cov_147.017689_3_plen_356_part_00